MKRVKQEAIAKLEEGAFERVWLLRHNPKNPKIAETAKKVKNKYNIKESQLYDDFYTGYWNAILGFSRALLDNEISAEDMITVISDYDNPYGHDFGLWDS